MKYAARVCRALRMRRCRALRVLVAAVLLGFLSMEILPLGWVEDVPSATGDRGKRSLCIEPLQVCDHGDSFFGVLFDVPVLLPGGLAIFPSPGIVRLCPEGAVSAPEGYHPPIDHPPHHTA